MATAAPMNDVMVDLETTGTDPHYSGIIQIAAMRFDYESCQVGPSFCMSLTLAKNRFWSEDTREWWMDHPDVYEKIVSQEQDAEMVWNAFCDWMQMSGGNKPNRMWAKPSSFEYPLLQSYGAQFNRPLSIHYRDVVDLHSFTRGLRGNPGAVPIDRQIEFVGEVHNAIDDVAHQVKIALSARHMLDV